MLDKSTLYFTVFFKNLEFFIYSYDIHYYYCAYIIKFFEFLLYARISIQVEKIYSLNFMIKVILFQLNMIIHVVLKVIFSGFLILEKGLYV